MKREIKFRAWDKVKSQMLFEGVEYELRMLSHKQSRKFSRSNIIGFSELDWDRFELMQYTGLNGENGELYEADILDCIEINGTYTKGVIEFRNGCFVVKQIGAEGLWDYLSRHNFAKAIGNIYENPELLNQ